MEDKTLSSERLENIKRHKPETISWRQTIRLSAFSFREERGRNENQI